MKHLIVRCLLVFLIFHNINSNAYQVDDDNTETTQVIHGHSMVFLNADAQKISGLKTLKLKKVELQAESIRYGLAISIQPLLTMHQRYLSAKAKQTGAKARLTQAEKSILRLRTLHKNQAISTRKLQYQQSQWQSEQAIYHEMRYQRQLIIDVSKLQWGETLTHWATARDSAQFDALINGQSTLLKVTLAAGNSLPSQINHIAISPTGDRNSASSASFVSILPQVDAFSQGLQYLFITDSTKIKAGMSFTAWIPQQQQTQTGIIIPESSLVWHLGEAFVFIKTDEEHFTHRNITQAIKVAQGYFITEQLADGEQIVITGTQMLLSHEFRLQIPAEDDDDD